MKWPEAPESQDKTNESYHQPKFRSHVAFEDYCKQRQYKSRQTNVANIFAVELRSSVGRPEELTGASTDDVRSEEGPDKAGRQAE